ncbi:hypothetical protein BJ508DRAFT_300935 [Ascobolus immersus RN42]|uniref:Tet-like 2OG-Fe(II) oxygenase domain-containing protein n=1 Tax=Ascobolus immersus RN42 TaxID=1160509 RepID=A0A3N4J187_ASCIM|nr:hypothetical protein BJ508DRAFT_300935 [Ascobolus immersus RN42]
MGRHKKGGRGKESKKRQKKKKDKKSRRLMRQAFEEKTIATWGIGPSGILPKPIVRLHKRDSELEVDTYGQLVEYDDPILVQEFKTIDGRASCIYTALDKDTKDVVFVAKVHLYKDMSDTQKSHYQRLFTYFAKDQAIKGHQHLKNGAGAAGGGHMNAVGWRPAYETGVHVDTYTSGILRQRFTAAEIKAHEIQLESIHQAISNSFMALSSHIFNQQHAELRDASTPAAGYPYGAKGLSLDGCFCSNIAYTYGGFHNSVHCDNDTSSYTYDTPGIHSHRMAFTCQIAKRLVQRVKMYRTQFSIYHARAESARGLGIGDSKLDDPDYVPDP